MKNLIACTAAILASAPLMAAEVPPFDPSKWSSAVTECDRLAAHPDDPMKLSAGFSEKQVDLVAAIPACKAAVAADPENPRLNYQLARTLGYAGRGAEAYGYREKAVAGNYPQALFVIGYITLFGMNEQPQDACKAGDLIRRAALAGRYAGQVGFVHYALRGMFKGCPVPQDRKEMARFLRAADSGGNYYHEMLVESLQDRLAAAR